MYEKVAVVPISIVALTTTTIDINCSNTDDPDYKRKIALSRKVDWSVVWFHLTFHVCWVSLHYLF